MPTASIDLTQAAHARSADRRRGADNPPRSKIRSPLYEAKADPDIYFFGFDLTIAGSQGRQSGENPNDDAGWFFVIKERPGEPRFGLELSRTGPPDGVRPAHLGRRAAGRRSRASSCRPAASPSVGARRRLRSERSGARTQQHMTTRRSTRAAPSSARWAYLLFRAPVMVAVHADEMLA